MPHASCRMPHAPCPRCRAANATAAKCDLQPIIVRASEGSSCLSLSLSLASSLSLSVRAKNKISENLQLSGCSRGSNNNDAAAAAAAAASSRRPSTKMFMHFFWSLTVLKVFRILLLLRRRRRRRRRRCVNCMRTKIDEYARRRRARAMPPQLVMEQGEAGKQGSREELCAPKNNTKVRLQANLLHSQAVDAGNCESSPLCRGKHIGCLLVGCLQFGLRRSRMRMTMRMVMRMGMRMI